MCEIKAAAKSHHSAWVEAIFEEVTAHCTFPEISGSYEQKSSHDERPAEVLKDASGRLWLHSQAASDDY